MSLPSFNLPRGYSRVRVVKSFDELVTTRFGDGVNALCWERTLAGDFSEVVGQLGASEEIVTLDDARLRALSLGPAGKTAVEILLEDQERLRALGLAPVLDCIPRYPRDEDGGVVPTDVYSFHVDSASVETDTYLCSYAGAASEGLRNDEAQRCVDRPETRAELLKHFGGSDNGEFRDHLKENCYDLHYVPISEARPFSFGLGNLWRIAVDYPGSPVPPCVHRAPETLRGQPPRLLLIS
ncbi:MAG: hypothetical protein JWM32_245 [Verrucomicrobia bacterium]|nr:hypothetical protein [Verrucomicrobiota bacterium]